MSSNNRRSHTPLERPELDTDIFEEMGYESGISYIATKFGEEVKKRVDDAIRESECEGFYFSQG